MTQEIFNKAANIDHDITVLKNILKNIKFEQDKRLGRISYSVRYEESSFWDSEIQFLDREIQDDFKNFINSELEKAQKLLREL